jgi:gluconolactonase
MRVLWLGIFAAAMLIGLGIPERGQAEFIIGIHFEKPVEMTLADIVPAGAKPEVVGSGYKFCEGPTPDAKGNVYFSDGDRNSIHFYEVGKPVRLFVGDSSGANGQKVNAKGELYTCEGSAFRVVAFNVATKQKRVLCSEIDGRHFNQPNDLTIDHLDGCYFTDPDYGCPRDKLPMKEDVYYCSPAGKVTRVSTVCTQPNGILLTADEKTLYIADWLGKRIFKCDVLAPGKLANQRKWIDAGGEPDGLAMDEHGNLYAACGGGGVRIFSPSGKFIGAIRVKYASNVCFGGKDFSTLYITAAHEFLALKTRVAGVKPLPARIAQGTNDK